MLVHVDDENRNKLMRTIRWCFGYCCSTPFRMYVNGDGKMLTLRTRVQLKVKFYESRWLLFCAFGILFVYFMQKNVSLFFLSLVFSLNQRSTLEHWICAMCDGQRLGELTVAGHDDVDVRK